MFNRFSRLLLKAADKYKQNYQKSTPQEKRFTQLEEREVFFEDYRKNTVEDLVIFRNPDIYNSMENNIYEWFPVTVLSALRNVISK